MSESVAETSNTTITSKHCAHMLFYWMQMSEFNGQAQISSVESQKGAINIKRCSVEIQKGTIAVQSPWW